MEITVINATYEHDDAILFTLNIDGEETPYVYRADDPYMGQIGVFLAAWIVANSHLIQPYVPPIPQPPAPYNLPVTELWNRLTEEEAEEFDGVASTASPLKLRKQFATATSMMSDSELFTWVRNILVGLFGETRADALLVKPLPSYVGNDAETSPEVILA